MKTRKIIVAISILLLLLSSCAEAVKTEASNKQWLQKLICIFPCWQNITPNETKFEDVMRLLQDAKVTFHSATGDEIGFTFEENIYGSIHKASNGIVDAIMLSVHDAKLSMGDLETVIGLPTRLDLIRNYDGRRYCRANLLYPEYGTVLEVHVKNRSRSRSNNWWECRVNLTSDSEVSRIVLLGINLDESEFWKRSYSSLRYSNKEWKYGYLEWKGYGSYPKMDNDPLWEQ